MAAWKVNCYLKGRLGKKTDYEGGVSGTYGIHCGKKQQASQCSGTGINIFGFVADNINNPGAAAPKAGGAGGTSAVIQNGDCEKDYFHLALEKN